MIRSTTEVLRCRPRKPRNSRRRAASPGSDTDPEGGAASEGEEEDADAAAAVLEADIAQLQASAHEGPPDCALQQPCIVRWRIVVTG